jgi:hypothetical protein
MTLTINRELLPEAEYERNQILKTYFCELVASATAVGEKWSIELSRPHKADFYIDLDLEEGLRWWSSNFGATDVAGIPFALSRPQGWQISLNDSWTIYSWSRWLTESVPTHALPASLTVLHLDDHDDLMAPRVLADGENFRDLITGSQIDLWRPETVEAAVRSGAIGIGSFMAPFFHQFKSVHVRHLCSTEYSKSRQGAHFVRPLIILDDLIAPGSRRLGLELRRLESEADAVHQQTHPYLVTDDLSSWLEGLPEGPVLIHIDMDYFNNRFNGDSDWVDYGPKYDPPLSDVLARIDAVFASLENSKVTERVVDLAVGLSPGFFPAELWAPSIERIQSLVESLIAAKKWPVGGHHGN